MSSFCFNQICKLLCPISITRSTQLQEYRSSNVVICHPATECNHHISSFNMQLTFLVPVLNSGYSGWARSVASRMLIDVVTASHAQENNHWENITGRFCLIFGGAYGFYVTLLIMTIYTQTFHLWKILSMCIWMGAFSITVNTPLAMSSLTPTVRPISSAISSLNPNEFISAITWTRELSMTSLDPTWTDDDIRQGLLRIHVLSLHIHADI